MSAQQNRFFAVLQKVGQSLMIPVSVLPAAGLLVAVGRMILNATEVAGAAGAIVVTQPLFHALGKLCYSGGLAIFEQLPAIFAVGVAIGFTGGAGVAALAAVTGYFTLTNVLGVMKDVRGLGVALNTGVFGGILVGLITAQLYQRFYQTKLPQVFGFFQGKRLVPILTVGASILLGVFLGFFWPPVQNGIQAFGNLVMASYWGPAFYAAGKRLLIPVGLHHVYYPSFLYEFGEYVSNGKVFKGESARYFAGDPTAGRFMASEFPLMLFGLPAAALAMTLRALPEKRKMIAGVMLSAALTSIITGITEPIEFAFIFVAPILFVFHVLMAFLSGVLVSAFDIHLGYTFSASLIDFGLGYFNEKNAAKLFLIVGPLMALVYFGVFYAAIGYFKLKTPGREAGEDSIDTSQMTTSDRAVQVLAALGGASNIVNIDACVTRLRLQVKNSDKISQPQLKELGASGVMNAGGGNVQVVFGTQSDFLKEEIKAVMAGRNPSPATVAPVAAAAPARTPAPLGATVLKSPLKGRLLPIDDVPDATFAEKILGDGFAIDPVDGTVVSPVDAEVVQVFRTKHAVGLVTDSGLEILIHVGIDTVKMDGAGFTSFVSQGQRVKAGDKLLQFDLALVKAQAKSAITPVVITNMDLVKGLQTLATGNVVPGQDVLSVKL